MKKAIIIIVSVLVVAIATCTGLYFFTIKIANKIHFIYIIFIVI